MPKLKTGFTTGASAAAATKGALLLILDGEIPDNIQIRLLTGEHIFVPPHSSFLKGKNKAVCTVIKDAGDDPDVTHGAEIGVEVLLENENSHNNVIIKGGKGVGIVTKPGLEIAPGFHAINPGPIKMITQSVQEVLHQHNISKKVTVTVFVPKGAMLAEKTLNARLGILGGISILGTTGLVKPMSHDAYIATIKASISVAKALDLSELVFTTGRRSERYAQILLSKFAEESFVQIGDFFKSSLEAASNRGFKSITLAVFFGKAIKMAQGIAHTHASKSNLTMCKLSDWSFKITKNHDFAKKILSANTARHAFDFIINEYPEIISYVGKLMIKSAKQFAGKNICIRAVIFDYEGKAVFDSGKNT